jgi:hypothetical protein
LVCVCICESIGGKGVNSGREVGNVKIQITEDKISEEVSFSRVSSAVSQMVKMSEVSQVEVVESREGIAVEVYGWSTSGGCSLKVFFGV